MIRIVSQLNIEHILELRNGHAHRGLSVMIMICGGFQYVGECRAISRVASPRWQWESQAWAETPVRNEEMDRSKVELYAAGGAELVKAYWGLNSAQLHAKQPDGSWTLHQNAIHMLDSDLIGSDRMKRIACMDNPLLCGYDETAFSLLPGSDQLNAFAACELFQKNRAMTATILRALPDSTFQRTGIHTESGKVSLAEMVGKYIDHLRHHLIFIAKKRAKLDGRVSE